MESPRISCPLTWCGEELELRQERAVYWKRKETLLIADPHFGKDATFRRFGVPIPAQMGQDDLARLATVLNATGAKRLIVLGDFLHAKSGRSEATLSAFSEWRAGHAGLKIVLVRGNHDLGAGDPPPDWQIEAVNEPREEPPFLLRHFPPEETETGTLAGHLHPAVTLGRAYGERMTLPCFLFRGQVGILPAFGSFTGSARISPSPGDEIFVIGETGVMRI